MASLTVGSLQSYIPASQLVWNVIAPFIGAYFGYRLRGRELSKLDYKDRAGEIDAELTGLSAVARLHWSRDTVTAPGGDLDVAHEAEILGRLHTINTFVEGMVSALSNDFIALVRGSVIEIRQAVTSGDFAATRGHGRSSTAIARTFMVAAQLRAQLRAGLRNKWS